MKYYEIQEKLDYSSNCSFYLVNNTETGKYYLAKYYAYFHIYSDEEILDFSRELHILSKLNHPSFLSFIGYSLKDFERLKKIF